MLRPVLNSYILSILYIEATHASNENVCVFVVLLITIEPEDALQVICSPVDRNGLQSISGSVLIRLY